jgi:hypothetical protein
MLYISIGKLFGEFGKEKKNEKSYKKHLKFIIC